MDSPIIIHGHFSPHYQALYDAFTANFIERGDVGAGFARGVDGGLVGLCLPRHDRRIFCPCLGFMAPLARLS